MSIARKEGEVIPFFLEYGQRNAKRDLESLNALCDHWDLTLRVGKIEAPQKWSHFKLSYFVFRGLMEAQKENCVMMYYGISVDSLFIEKPISYLTTFRLLTDSIPTVYDTGLTALPKLAAEAPLAYLDTKRIIRMGSETDHNIPWDLTYSCEGDGLFHCGLCPHCLRRRRAFKDNDPTLYKRRN